MNIEHFKERLSTEKATLEAELSTVGRRNPANPNDWEAIPQEVGQEADPNDQADLLEGFRENTAILTDLENRYNDVVAALERIEAGTYGACAACGNPIEEDRLEAEPAAKTCKAHLNG
ncbi:MAG TPA: TraR/DksA C4-type zinc finger protein [Candidatus Paceibacterota bacterium]|nr:TraR/DksA C4-type zinc finger protein [Candidatus Paceibacterota bacterium]